MSVQYPGSRAAILRSYSPPSLLFCLGPRSHRERPAPICSFKLLVDLSVDNAGFKRLVVERERCGIQRQMVS